MEGISSVSIRGTKKVVGRMAEQLLLEVKNNRRFQSTSTNYGTFAYNKTGIVLNSIEKCPGIRYRELLRFSGLTNGALEYILRILEKTDRIKVERQNGKRPRYYPLNIMSNESSILGHIRNKSSRQIVLFMLEHKSCTFSDILKHIKKAPSTLSWHLKMLSEAGIIAIVRTYKHSAYRILNRELVSNVLTRYGESFETNMLTSNTK